MHQQLPIHMLLWNILRVVTQCRQGSVFEQKSGRVDDDVQNVCVGAFYEKDGRRNRYIGEVLERYRGEDAGDLKRSELDELVENRVCLNAVKKKMWKINAKILIDENSWRTWKSNQNSVMNEALVQNSVMNEERVQNDVMNETFVKNFVMDGQNLSEGCDGSVHNQNWWMENFATQ